MYIWRTADKLVRANRTSSLEELKTLQINHARIKHQTMKDFIDKRLNARV